MIDVTLLGGVSISTAGVQLSGEAAQHRRVALLALLAAPGLRSVSRDRLIGWLWPDHDPESARHLLSAALHVLRKALGPDAILTTGDDVALNPALVRVDVAAFREAVAAGELERALALYGGDFMEGFFVNDAADFSQWVDGERDELRRLFGETLERAAAARARTGDAPGAVQAWRRRAALDPYDARVALELMRALAAAGQRPAAIQHARLHAQLLEQEFGAEPDRQVEALAAALRQAPADPVPAALRAPQPQPTTVPVVAPGFGVGPDAPRSAEESLPAAPAPAVAAAARPYRLLRGIAAWLRAGVATAVLATVVFALLAVLWPTRAPAPFVIAVRRCESDEDSLRGRGAGFADDLHAEIGRLQGVQMVARDVGFATAGQDPQAAIRRLRADALLSCRLYTEQDSLHLHAELIDANARDLVVDEVSGTDEAALEYALLLRVSAAIGRDATLSPLMKVAAAFGRDVDPAVLLKPASGRIDPVAFRHYLTGRTAWLQRTPESLRSALREYESATRIAPDYAKAWAGVADAYNMLGSYDYAGMRPGAAYPRAKRAAERALALDRHLSDAYAALANVQANYEWDWAAAEKNYRKAISLARSHTSANEWYALLLAARGRFAQARQQTAAAVEEQPTVPLTLVNQAHVFYYAGDFAAARTAVDRALALPDGRSFSRALILRALIDLAAGQVDAALAQFTAFRAAVPEPEPVLIALLGYAQARHGDTDAARAQLEWLRRAETRTYVPRELLAALHVALGDIDAAFQELQQAFDERSSGMMYLRVEPLIAPLRSDPRYRRLVDSVH
ncbi:MAG: hypothetical protein FIB01_06475 [Gemmatimonadetes bacterium]|nr:hypothetical protein [Gemmatimonadota bacterium]